MNGNIISKNGSSSTTQACAACKYQRRKCGPNCILAPYFPHHRQKQFLNAHKLFGVGKITNMAKNVPSHLRDATMASIIYQSDMREAYPVGGCLAIVQHLQSSMYYLSAELRLTLQQLAIVKGSHVNDYDVTINHNIINNNSNNNVDVASFIPHYFEHQIPQHVDVVDQSSYINMNDIALQEDLSIWANSIPLLSDKKEEELVGDNENDDQKPVLDLINEMNLDSSRSSIDG